MSLSIFYKSNKALIEAIHDWASANDKEHHVDLILLDFSKALDRVPHSWFHSKLNYYRICKITQAWIQTFLSNRCQCVSVNGVLSKCPDVTSGVPQGCPWASPFSTLYKWYIRLYFFKHTPFCRWLYPLSPN